MPRSIAIFALPELVPVKNNRKLPSRHVTDNFVDDTVLLSSADPVPRELRNMVMLILFLPLFRKKLFFPW